MALVSLGSDAWWATAAIASKRSDGDAVRRLDAVTPPGPAVSPVLSEKVMTPPSFGMRRFPVEVVEVHHSPEPRDPSRIEIEPRLANANVCLSMIEDHIHVRGCRCHSAMPAADPTQREIAVMHAPRTHASQPHGGERAIVRRRECWNAIERNGGRVVG